MKMRHMMAAGLALAMACGSFAHAAEKTGDSFLRTAIRGNLAEISMGELAQKNGSTDAVRSYGAKLVADHTAANEKAVSLAKSKNIRAPKKPNKKAVEDHDSMAKLSGTEFDTAFAKHMVKDHRKAIKRFNEQAASGDDAELVAFAKETLPTLEEHLATAKSLAGTGADESMGLMDDNMTVEEEDAMEGDDTSM